MASGSGSASSIVAWTYIAEPSEGGDQTSAQDFRAALEKGTDDLKLDCLRRIVIGTLNGTSYVSWLSKRVAGSLRIYTVISTRLMTFLQLG